MIANKEIIDYRKMANELAKFLSRLSDKEWQVKVTDKWNVREVLAHIVGWEKENVKVLSDFLKKGKKDPWHQNEDYEQFNDGEVEFYKNYSSKELLKEWEKLRDKFNELVVHMNTIV